MKYLFLLLSLSIIFISCGSDTLIIFQKGSVQIDSIVTIVESGQLESMNASIVSAPGDWRMEYRINYLAAEGSIVEEGDTVVIFDTEQAQSKRDEANAKLEIQIAKLNETMENNALTLNQKKINLQQLELQYEINKNQVENAKYESDAAQKEMELELEKTRLRLIKARQDLETQKILNQNSENLISLEISQAQVQIERAKKMMSDMYLISRRGGLVVYQKQGWGGEGEKVKVGDNVYPQTSILSIPDLDAMKAVILLNEVDRPYIQTGAQADVVVEAYPDTVFHGKIVFVSKIVNREDGANNLKTYNVYIKIDSKENFRLKPGLSAKVTIYAKSLNDVYRIPAWCLFNDRNNFYVQSIAEGKIPITLVQLNNGFAFVKGDLTADAMLKPNEAIPRF